MRELGITEADEGLAETFEDVDELVEGCRFRDCTHEHEPGCAVRAALEAGELSEERWASYIKLRKEAAYERRRTDVGAALAEKRRWKQIHKSMREHYKKK
jgi:ribosome biogenesis GTPase